MFDADNGKQCITMQNVTRLPWPLRERAIRNTRPKAAKAVVCLYRPTLQTTFDGRRSGKRCNATDTFFIIVV